MSLVCSSSTLAIRRIAPPNGPAQAYERLATLRVPSAWRDQIDAGALTVRVGRLHIDLIFTSFDSRPRSIPSTSNGDTGWCQMGPRIGRNMLKVSCFTNYAQNQFYVFTQNDSFSVQFFPFLFLFVCLDACFLSKRHHSHIETLILLSDPSEICTYFCAQPSESIARPWR